MVDRYKLSQEILALADKTPMNYVDIADIIQESTLGLQFSEQSSVRMAIRNILKELEESGDITYHRQQLSDLTTSQGGQYFGNSVLVKTTLKRQKEIESANKQTSTNIQNIGVNYGLAAQSSDFRESRPKIKPTVTPADDSQKISGKASLLTKSQKLIVEIIVGIVIMVIGTFILIQLGWIKI